MLERLHKLLAGAGDLFRAEAEVALLSLRRALLASMLVMLGAVLLAVAVLILGVAGTALLAQRIGWAGAGAIVSGVVLIVSVALLTIGRTVLAGTPKRSLDEARDAADRSRGELQNAVTPGDTEGDPSPGADDTEDETEGLTEAATRYVLEHPAQVAGATFAVLAIVGPFRTLRLLGRGAAAASLIGTVTSHVKSGTHASSNGTANGHATTNGTGRFRSDPPTPRHPPRQTAP